MLEIKSNEAHVNASTKKVFDFIADFNNFEKLLPEDKVENWQTDGESCSFTVKGLAGIGMKIVERKEPSEIQIESHGKNPFPFTLTVFIEEEGQEKSKAYLLFNGKVNPFMKMMAEKPLTNFFNMLADRLNQQF